MPVSSVTEHWIKPDAVTINLNHFGDPDYLQVSVLAGAVVMAFKQDVIGYNAAHNYRTWPLQAANTYLELTSAYNVYARLTRSEVNASALIVYDPILRDIEGRPISHSEKGEEFLGEADPTYFYVFLGQISSSIGSSGQSINREWIVDFRFGNLDTSQYRNEEAGGEWQKMFRLNKVTDMIDVLKTFSSAVFKRLFIGEKEIQDVQRASDETLTPRVDDLTIPTTQFNENRFLSKKKDDRSTGTIASDKGFVVGDFNEGTLGSGASTFMRDGSSYSEVDFLKVRKKATFTNITIQELKHIGGEIILSPAAMVVSEVEELEDGSGYICYFDSEDFDGHKIYNEFELDDLARCQTFNLSPEGADDLIGNHYYWRKVIEVGENFIVLSKKEFEYDDNSDIPQVGDNICQLGNTTNTKRQAAVIISAYGSDAPSYKQYNGIDGFSLDGKQVTKLSPYGNELTGVLNIEKGSKGWENFEGLPEEIQKAASATDILEDLEYGKNNMLRNSGFTGDYLTAVLNGSTSLKDTSEMFSPSLKHWEYVKATAIEEKDYSESGKAVQIQDGGSISQTLYFKVIKNEKYIFSFRGKGGNVTYSIGGHTWMFELTDEWSQHVDKFTASSESDIFRIEVSGDCTLCELQLERGTVKSAWGISPLDNRSELAKYDSLTYLQAALKGETDILGGLINTNLINMGMYDEESKMTKTTAGINGLYNEDRSIAFWAGGTSEQAVFAESTYLDNPNYIPTQEELQQMAKFVVTHGGRAILNDIILRGYIYALGGFFKGEVNAEKGVFKNIQSPNGHFKINENGDVEIVGKVETSVNGKRIVIDADTNSIILYDQIGRETAKMAFSEGMWATGFVSLKQFNGESSDVIAETTITPHYSTFHQNGFKTFFGFDGMKVEKDNDGEILMKVGLNPYGSGVNIEGYEPIMMIDESIGITQDITINAFYATHKLTFKDGLLVGYTRTDNDN